MKSMRISEDDKGLLVLKTIAENDEVGVCLYGCCADCKRRLTRSFIQYLPTKGMISVIENGHTLGLASSSNDRGIKEFKQGFLSVNEILDEALNLEPRYLVTSIGESNNVNERVLKTSARNIFVLDAIDSSRIISFLADKIGADRSKVLDVVKFGIRISCDNGIEEIVEFTKEGVIPVYQHMDMGSTCSWR